MQARNETFRDFLERTDRLAYQKGSKTEDLTVSLGISRASLFGYRSGRRSIPAKVWMALDDAEKAAGILDSSSPTMPMTEDNGSSHQDTKDEPTQLDRIESALVRIAEALEKLTGNR